MMRSKNFRAATISAAIGVVIACVVAVVVAAMLQPAPQPTEPAPLPPGTGVDGAGAGEPVIVQPDAGPNVVVKPGPDGTGGQVYGRTLALYRGTQDVRVNAGKFYSSGGAHYAIDWGVWRGTPVYAPRDSLVVGRNNGVPNDNGASPSNWVLLCRNVEGKPALMYLQHLSPGFIIDRGPVKAGQLVGYSGNSGNSTGDHLHQAAGWSPEPCNQISQTDALWLRYRYLNDTSTAVFEPTKWEYEPRLPVVNLSVQIRAAKTKTRSPGTKYVRRALKLPAAGPNGDRYNVPVRRAFKKRYPQTRPLGIPTCNTLTHLGRGRFVVNCKG